MKNVIFLMKSNEHIHMLQFHQMACLDGLQRVVRAVNEYTTYEGKPIFDNKFEIFSSSQKMRFMG